MAAIITPRNKTGSNSNIQYTDTVVIGKLRIDKGSRAVRCVIACSGGTIRSTVIF